MPETLDASQFAQLALTADAIIWTPDPLLSLIAIGLLFVAGVLLWT